MLYSTLVLLLALLPITALHGEAGAFVPSIAFAFVIAVLVSLIVAVAVTPLLSLVVFRGRDRAPRMSPLMARVLALHRKVGSRLLKSPRSPFGTLAALLLVGLVALPFVKRGDSLVPSFKDRSVLVHWEAAPGTSLTEMSRITARASQEIGALPGIGGVGAHVGRAVGGDQIVGTGSGEMWVTMKSSAAYAETLQSIRSVVSGYPGMVHSVLTYPTERIQRMLNSTGRDLTVRIFGDDFAVLNSKAVEVAKALGAVKGVRDPKIRSAPVEPALEVKVNLDAANKVGIKPGDVRRAATTLVSGLTVGALFEEQKVFDVVVVGEPATRASLTAIKDLTIESPTGKHVRLGDVADVAIAPGLSAIRHEDVSRYIDVDANVSGRTTESAAADAKDALKGISFPLQHRAVLLGDYTQRRNERREFLVLSVAAALGILLLLQSAFRSWRLAAVVFVTLPASLAGGVVGALVAAPFSLGSLVGFFALFALAARSTLMLIGRYRELELHESTADRADLVLKGTRDSIAPVLLTVTGIVSVLLPFLVFSNAAGFEIAHRLAVVVVCGLVSTTLFALVIVPALYLRFGRPTEPDVWALLELPERAPVAAAASRVSSNGDGDGVQRTTTAGRDD